jgi:hypothetical protein
MCHALAMSQAQTTVSSEAINAMTLPVWKSVAKIMRNSGCERKDIGMLECAATRTTY